MAHRVVEHFEGTLRGQGLTPTRRLKIQEWEERVHKSGASVEDVADLEKIFKRGIVLRDIAGEDVYSSGKYHRGGGGGNGSGVKKNSSSTMATPGPRTSTFPSPGKSTSTRATSGMPSVKLPMANR